MDLFVISIVFIVMLVLHARYKMKYSWEDIFSPKRWKAVYVWFIKKQLNFLGENQKYLTTSELIQYSYRVSNCSECLIDGKCVHCGCDAEGRINGITDSCSANKWDAMLSEEEMKDFLKENTIEFSKPIIRKKDE